MIVESIIFDLDGTLVDSAAGVDFAIREAVRSVLPHKEKDLESIRNLSGPPMSKILGKALPGEGFAILQDIEKRFRVLYNNFGWQQSVAYEGVLATLTFLSSLGMRLFIVTNKPGAPTQNILDMLNLSLFFDRIISPDSVTPSHASKAHATEHLVKTSELDRASTLLVGDSREDAEAAQSCGLRFAAVTYGYTTFDQQSDWHKDFTLCRLGDLVNIIAPQSRSADDPTGFVVHNLIKE